MSDILIAEYEYQVEDFLKRGFPSEAKWIALGPSAMWALQQRRIKYDIPEDFYEINELEDICTSCHQKVEWLCNRLDECHAELYPELARWDVKPFLFSIFPLVKLFDGLISRAFMLESLMEESPKATIWAHLGPQGPLRAFDINFSNDQTLWGQMLALKGWHSRVELLGCAPPFESDGRSPGKRLRSISRSLISKSLTHENAYEVIRSGDWKGLLDLCKWRKKPSLLVNNNACEWSNVIPHLKKSGCRVLFVNDQMFTTVSNEGRKRSGTGLEVLERSAEIKECFQFHGISFYPLLEERIAWIFNKTPQFFAKIKTEIQRLTEDYQVKAVLSAITPTFSRHTIDQVGRKLGLEVLKWQHGFTIFNERINQLYEFNDMMTSDTLLTYGREAERAYAAYKDKFPAKIISVGSGKIDKIRASSRTLREQQDRQHVKRILYITTNYYQNKWYCGFSPPFNDNLYYRDQLLIAKKLKGACETYPIEVTVKLSPTEQYQEPPWVEGLIQHANLHVVKYSPTVAELLSEHDIVVIDSPTTTTLEAIAADKPAFILMRHIGYPPSAKQVLAKRAVCADDAEELMDKLFDYLESDTYCADLDDTVFLRAYGNHKDDGKSVERAMKIMERVIAK